MTDFEIKRQLTSDYLLLVTPNDASWSGFTVEYARKSGTAPPPPPLQLFVNMLTTPPSAEFTFVSPKPIDPAVYKAFIEDAIVWAHKWADGACGERYSVRAEDPVWDPLEEHPGARYIGHRSIAEFLDRDTDMWLISAEPGKPVVLGVKCVNEELIRRHHVIADERHAGVRKAFQSAYDCARMKGMI